MTGLKTQNLIMPAHAVDPQSHPCASGVVSNDLACRTLSAGDSASRAGKRQLLRGSLVTASRDFH